MEINNVAGLPTWLTLELSREIRRFYEPKYRRNLTDIEVWTIAENLTGLMEHYLKFIQKNRRQHAR